MSKRIVTSGGVIQRANGTSAAGSGSVIADLLLDLAHAAARWAASPSPSCASTAPPGNTHAPPMKRAFGVRWTSRTSSRSAPPRSTMTVAAWRGVGRHAALVEVVAGLGTVSPSGQPKMRAP